MEMFERLGQPVAQVLLTRNDIADRTQYLNAQNTFIELLHMGVIPIVNENDTIAVSEIKFGDNDTLSAITAGMVQADYLFLMTDVDCLYDSNPRTNPNAKAIAVVEDISKLTADVSSRGSALGTGGMSTKIVAARLATAAGVTTVITRSSKPGNIAEIVAYAEALKNGSEKKDDGGSSATPADIPTPPLHTRFLPSQTPIPDRRFWLLHGLAPHGTIYVDQGAAKALAGHAGLLPVGIVDVDGSFSQQECVRLVAVAARRKTPGHLDRSPSTTAISSTHAAEPSSHEIGRALVNYSATEIRRIAGLRSADIASILGYADGEYVALRENVALLSVLPSRPTTPSTSASNSVNPRRGGGVGTFFDSAADTSASSSNNEIPGRATGGLGGYVEG